MERQSLGFSLGLGSKALVAVNREVEMRNFGLNVLYLDLTAGIGNLSLAAVNEGYTVKLIRCFNNLTAISALLACGHTGVYATVGFMCASLVYRNNIGVCTAATVRKRTSCK